MSSDALIKQTQKSVKRSFGWLIGLVAALVIFVAVEAVIIVVQFKNETVPQKFTFPTQEVQNRVENIEGPAIKTSDNFINVNAKKCVDGNDSIIVNTEVVWATIEPRGTIVTDWTGSQVLEPGCNPISYNNPVPDLVVARTEELVVKFPDLDCIEWQIVGVDNPIDPRVSQPKRWTTQSFCIYPA
mgnify:CR=1 FL=1